MANSIQLLKETDITNGIAKNFYRTVATPYPYHPRGSIDRDTTAIARDTDQNLRGGFFSMTYPGYFSFRLIADILDKENEEHLNYIKTYVMTQLESVRLLLLCYPKDYEDHETRAKLILGDEATLYYSGYYGWAWILRRTGGV